MTNSELTLDQLTAITGGVQMAPDGSTCTDRHIRKAMERSKRMQKYTNGTSREGMLVAKTGANPGQMLSPLSGGDGCPF